MKTPYALEHHVFNPQDAQCHLYLFAIASRDLNKLRGRGRGLTVINHRSLPSTVLSALHILSHWNLLQSCEPLITSSYRWNWGRERLNLMPRSPGCPVTVLCIICTQPVTYMIFKAVKLLLCILAQSCPNSLRPHGLQPARLLCPWGFSRREYRRKLLCFPPGDLPNPGIKPRSPTLQANSLLSELPGKPENPGASSLSLLQGIFPT